ncbi:MAG: TetR family transcriptional regulator C-terminal domain-containing protein, partial [Acidimicrobiales bacterium]
RALIELSGAIWHHVSQAEPDPLKRLFALLRLQVSGWAPFERRWAFWLEFWSAARRIDTLKPHVAEIYGQWQQPFQEALTEAAGARLVRLPEPVEPYSLKLMALIDGLVVRALVDPDTVDERRVEELLFATVASDLRIRPPLLNSAVRSLPRVIGADYPDETAGGDRIDWSPLDLR